MTTTAPDPKTVFVVSGRNRAANDGMFLFLRSIGLSPLEWSQTVGLTGEGSPYIGKVLDAAFGAAAAIVVLMTPDDLAQLHPDLLSPDDPDYERRPTGQARPNVLFEAGMAMGRDPERTILIECGQLRPFSDVGGRHAVRINNSTARRQGLAERLRTAGCDIDLTGTHWHADGDLDPPRLSAISSDDAAPEVAFQGSSSSASTDGRQRYRQSAGPIAALALAARNYSPTLPRG